MDGGAWWAAVHGVVKSWTRLSDFPFSFHFHALEKEMATHSSVLAWRIPGTGEPGGLLSVGSHRVGHDWSDLAAAAEGFSAKAMAPHSSVLAWRIPGMAEPVGLLSLGSKSRTQLKQLSSRRVLVALHPCLHLVLSLILAFLVGVNGCLMVVSICISLTDDNIELLFMCLAATLSRRCDWHGFLPSEM